MTKLSLLFANVLIISSFVFLSACTPNEEAEGSLVALGDSIPHGANLEQGDVAAYPYLIGKESGFEVQNLAVSGWQTGHVMEALRTDQDYQQAVKDADYVTLTIGGNDLFEVLDAAEAESAGDPVLLEELVLQKADSSIVFDKVGEVIEEIQSFTDAPILLYNVYNPFPADSLMYRIGESLLPQVNAAFADLAESYPDVHLADAYSAYRNKQNDYIIAHDVHPTEEGQAVLAEIGLKAMELD